MSALSLRGVVKHFGKTTIIHGADLEVAAGEFVVFVGPSGCGKSTLLRMIAGLESISEGEVLIGGRRMNEVPAGQRGVAMVFQSYALYPHMSVRENIGFGLKMAARMPKEEISRRVEAAAATLHLHGLLERKPAELSGGQRQRVAIGRAIVREPQVFLLDEPLSNLDAELRTQMRMEIRRLHARLRATMIHVTHDQVEAMTLADRIVVLRDGRIEQCGTPMELYHRPCNQFVAGFIGAPKMNFLPAVVQSVSAEIVLRLAFTEDATLTLPADQWRIAPGEKLMVGVRPNALPAGGRTAKDGACFSLAVEAGERLGGATCHYCKTRDGETVVVESPGESTADGGALPLCIAPADAHIFDPGGSSRRS
ncbi:MAG: sn-glycerol-3-phosphate ABC transporter ATP-binding protein UgpC [Gammaproteobacteria bacterium]|nr:sn-glycerol-3-phosphate ABC transporter ATP-binding protein UgpC [Gammaproteobacteria bacterium]MDD9851860.1 sn-glycerol-3-phosphate ABC transporter ATP-binding protein UgpC [Gammaproteobacteria bacterium]